MEPHETQQTHIRKKAQRQHVNSSSFWRIFRTNQQENGGLAQKAQGSRSSSSVAACSFLIHVWHSAKITWFQGGSQCFTGPWPREGKNSMMILSFLIMRMMYGLVWGNIVSLKWETENCSCTSSTLSLLSIFILNLSNDWFSRTTCLA